MFKINEKKFDCGRRFCELVSAHGKEQQQNTTMKKTLLIAAAALAAGIMTSQAQVYSQNIVGYANVPTVNASGSYLLSVPFKVGVSNGLNEVFGTSLQGAADFTQILIWSVANSSFTTYNSDSGSPSGWDDANLVPITSLPTLPAGQGFFLIPSIPNITNTFAGAVAINVGTTNSLTLPNASANYLVGAVVPYAGSVTNGNFTGLGVNMSFGAGQDFTQLLIWSVGSSSFTTYNTDSGSPSGWDDSNLVPIANPPSITVGQGFFLIPSAPSLVWKQSL